MCRVELITTGSHFFEHAVSGRWEDVNQKGVDLPVHEPATFEIYADWL